MSVETVLMKAGNLRRICEVTLTDGKVLTVEPYAIYTAGTKRQHYLLFQVPDSAGEGSGWRHPEARYVTSAKQCEGSFSPRREYDPFDREKFPVVHFSIPTHDGRQRWMDAKTGVDKQTLINRPL